jgi:hypothetical protein
MGLVLPQNETQIGLLNEVECPKGISRREQTLGRGHYSNDSAIHEATKGTEIYPWADKIEGEVRSLLH